MVTTPCLTKEPSDNSPRRRNPYWIRRSGRKVLPLKAVSFNTEHANAEVMQHLSKFRLSSATGCRPPDRTGKKL